MNINPEHYFVLQNGKVIKDLEELVQVLKNIDKKVFEYHVNDSKNDFASWIQYVFRSKRLAETIEDMRYREIHQMIKVISTHIDEVKMLVINSGSSSIKFQLIEFTSKNVLIKGMIDAIGLDRCQIDISINGENISKKVNAKDHEEAISLMMKALLDADVIGDVSEIKAVGHRVVHGGEDYTEPTIIDSQMIERLKQLSVLAPLHNPANIICIQACIKLFRCPQVAVFDTAFHSTIPKEKFLYGIPREYYDKFKIRKYGFHGTSHKYVAGLINEYFHIEGKKNTKVIICHLGNGCSITAVKNGKSLNTTMGFTPLGGLIMGTRSGDIDPGIILHLGNFLGIDYEQMGNILNKKSGLLGISGRSDMRDLHKNSGEEISKLAMDMFSDRIIHYIGAYIAEMNGIDAIIFTGGIGENAYYIRKAVLENFSYIGLKLDPKKNEKNDFIITGKDSEVAAFVIPTNEELEIATETKKVLKL
ncbi:MAG: acetate/propionate family kinase [Candidatus Woesearchaeota archaeon]